MGGKKAFLREKLLLGVLYGEESIYLKARAELIRRFGPIDFECGPLPFDYSDYYAEEMGACLLRRFLTFERLIDPSRLAPIKIWTNRLEERLARDGRRRINLDPGLIDLNRLVLASTKHSGHRIPLRLGIFAELTLHYRQREFHPFPWTYPDFRSDAYRSLLLEVREILHRQLKRGG